MLAGNWGFSIQRRLGGLDCDRKAPSRVALRAFENADIITRCCGFDARQPHGLAAFGAWKDSDLCTAEYWIGMEDDMMLPSIGREHAALSVTDNCRFGAGDGGILTRTVPDILVNIAHIGKV